MTAILAMLDTLGAVPSGMPRPHLDGAPPPRALPGFFVQRSSRCLHRPGEPPHLDSMSGAPGRVGDRHAVQPAARAGRALRRLSAGGLPPGIHRGLPSRNMTLIASIGAPIDVTVQTSPAQRPASYRCVVSGLQASAAQISLDGTQEGVSIALSPLGCRELLQMPAAELWDLSYELSEVRGPSGDELWERIQYAGDWSQRFAACDRVLLGWLRETATSESWPGAGVASSPRAACCRSAAWPWRLGTPANTLPACSAQSSDSARSWPAVSCVSSRHNERFAPPLRGLPVPHRGVVRLCRPGTPDAGVRRAGRVHSTCAARRGSSNPSRLHRHRGLMLDV